MNTKRVFPIPFSKLWDGSKFQIFAEPTRRIRRSDDTRTYVKVCDAWSHVDGDEDQVAILYPKDLVLPLSRGGRN